MGAGCLFSPCPKSTQGHIHRSASWPRAGRDCTAPGGGSQGPSGGAGGHRLIPSPDLAVVLQAGQRSPSVQTRGVGWQSPGVPAWLHGLPFPVPATAAVILVPEARSRVGMQCNPGRASPHGLAQEKQQGCHPSRLVSEPRCFVPGYAAPATESHA